MFIRIRYLSLLAVAGELLTLSGCATIEQCGVNGCPGDAKITTSVQTLLDKHADLGSPGHIRVETLRGVVYLYGSVSNGLEGRDAVDIAKNAPGVKQVVNSTYVSK